MDNDFVCSNSNDVALSKQPFRRLELAINQVTKVAIPFHVQLLKEQSSNIEKYKTHDQMLKLHSEQAKASNTVRLLRDDLYELETINAQVKEEDFELFQRKIQDPTRDVIETLSLFLDLHSDILDPFPEVEELVHNSSKPFPALVCQLEKENEASFDDTSPVEAASSLQCYATPLSDVTNAQKYWINIKKEILEINDLIKKFANLVFQQKTQVDTIEDNVIQARENVLEGTKELKKASIFKAASFPIAGAVLGGLFLGPVGALVGFKLLGCAACTAGGGILGFSAGRKLKKRHQMVCDIEMKALTYPSKTLSSSSPDLSTIPVDVPIAEKKDN